MTTRDDLTWYEAEVSRADDDLAHQLTVLRQWFVRDAEEADAKRDRLYAAERLRIVATYDARRRYLESEIERLKDATR